MVDLLPPNASEMERALAGISSRIDVLPVTIRDLWNPSTCPAALLPWLAWTLSVDYWDTDWPDETKRAVIAASYEVHKYKGTPYAVRTALQAIGYRDVDIVEGVEPSRHDGSTSRTGLNLYAIAGHWAQFRVVLDLGNDMGVDGNTASRVRSAVEYAKNARSHLYAIGYKVTLSDARHGDGDESLPLHVGMHVRSIRAGIRDGSLRRSSTGPWRRGGEIFYSGVKRTGKEGGPYFGQPRFVSPLRLSLGLASQREAYCPRDGAVTYAGRPRSLGEGMEHSRLTVRRTVARNGTHRRDGIHQYGFLCLTLHSFDSPYPARDGRHTRHNTFTFSDAHLEGA